ncbi:MAG: HlyC/CorC family transporter [Demequinaceae bacterium]|nr:HlyC/CorC family transporter [Demequinaceae bacterium]
MNGGLVFALLGLLAANAFFVGAEFAVISARRSAMEVRADQGSRAAKTVLWAMENVSLMLACAQLGITVCSITLGVLAEPALAHSLEGVTTGMGLSVGASHGLAVAIALLFIAALHVVLGEMVPKNAAVSSPDRAALIFGPALVVVARATRPIIVSLNWMANAFIRAMGITPRDEVTSAFTADEVHRIVQRSHEEGTLEDTQGLLTGAIEFSDRTASDVMVPIRQVRMVKSGATVAEIEAVIAETGFSRFPVADGQGLVGYLHLKDLLYARPTERGEPIHGWRIRQLPTVDAADEVEDVLALMRESGAHLARVRKEDRVVGMVFLEDIIEELVGEVGGSKKKLA